MRKPLSIEAASYGLQEYRGSFELPSYRVVRGKRKKEPQLEVECEGWNREEASGWEYKWGPIILAKCLQQRDFIC